MTGKINQIIEKLHEVLRVEHNKLGQELLDKSTEGQISSNWQGGKCNGIATAIELIKDFRGWQDIATAPKDGTRILVKDSDGGEVYITEWIDDVYVQRGILWKGSKLSGWFSEKFDWDMRPIIDKPTLWQELLT